MKGKAVITYCLPLCYFFLGVLISRLFMMFAMFIAILLSSSLLLSEPVAVPDHPLSISELVDIALSNNPDSKIAWWNARRAASSVDAAKSTYYPKLDLDLSANHGRDFEFINGPNKKY